jgi:hypothetical protein
MQKEKGKKAMLIKVNSITFWPNLVAARLSITLLALNSLLFISRMYFELLRGLLTPFRSLLLHQAICRGLQISLSICLESVSFASDSR